ncbi:flavoprotein [Salirhabdus sp. Marseille-P4669]|uniref:flavoprotein n=1 Tax=Salirhabdus sp. Marseille-P4669 TaxID=2042310 RepID=UPI000C7A1939|nr:flavoprotein [Salirhabdus sp. Marseille-P4669]
MDTSFRTFLDSFFTTWRNSAIHKLKEIISKDYQAREVVSSGEISDFGYEESIQGWEQGFTFAMDNNAEWELEELSILPLRDDEILVILSASMIIDGNSLETANVFFDTFKKNAYGEWKLVRSYIEAGINKENLSRV